MLESIKGLVVTLKAMAQSKITVEYPKQHLPIQPRFMGFPALTWDEARDEPFCTGCMVCVRYCPTQCMSATMEDNPKFADGESHRRKIIDQFEINLGRCILCGICVDVCNFDAIEMSFEHELGARGRNDNRVDLAQLLEMGRQYQAQSGWEQSKPNGLSPNEKSIRDAAIKTADSTRIESSEPQDVR